MSVGICHRCPHRRKHVLGAVPCELDGVDIIVHAAESVCPDGRYGTREWPEGFTLPVLGAVTVGVGVADVVKPVPATEWPLAAKIIRRMSLDHEAGVGSTLTRLLAGVGGDQFKRWYKKLTGTDCGCSDRAAKLDAMYPYA